jgi:hypothetical protein
LNDKAATMCCGFSSTISHHHRFHSMHQNYC